MIFTEPQGIYIAIWATGCAEWECLVVQAVALV
jgi:hypothetical protein